MTERRRLRVAFLVAGLETGGSERQMLALAKHMPRDRFEVEFVLFVERGPYANEAEAAGLKVINLEMGRRRDGRIIAWLFRFARMFGRYVRTMRQGRYDIVDAWLWHGSVIAALCRPIAGPPIFIAGRRSLSDYKANFGIAFRMLDMIARRSADLIVANSDAVRNDVIDREGVDARRILVVRNGVDLVQPMTIEMRAAIRERWGVRSDDLVVGSVATLKRQKGHESLVRAAAELSVRHPDLHVVIIGEGSYRPELERLIQTLAMGSRVHLVGWERDPRQVYGAIDIVVHASESEGLPNVLLEAAAAGRPIVATAAGGSAEIVVDAQTGLLVPIADAEALRVAIERLITDPALRGRLGSAARKRVANEFSMARLASETCAIYDALVASRVVRD